MLPSGDASCVFVNKIKASQKKKSGSFLARVFLKTLYST